ncbi:MAG TPA: hypothetical protein VGN93_13215 [Shinella sp.]|jgi:hypothetical protein|uniref:hypothetical protein n=1 Tax=Shinella sp. TaxID=1870904 RepID=UPI002E16893F|nr:hypothetical protein [Shinella sp.]
MPNTPVQATAEGLPGESDGDGGGRGRRFNLSQIMKNAWAIYGAMTRTARPSTIFGRRKWFANSLANAWDAAKRAAAEALKTASQRAAERVEQLTRQLQTLDARSFRYTITAERKALVTELATLQGEAA